MDPVKLVVPPRPAAHGDGTRPTSADTSAASPAPPPPAPQAGGRSAIARARSVRDPESSALTVRRTLPERRLTAIGAWCLLEHFGDTETAPTALATPAYPEAGLQSLTLPLDGSVRHRDGGGTDLLVRQGRPALFTAGAGVAVTEAGIDDLRGGRHARRCLHGVRLAAALPQAVRDLPPTVQPLDRLPRVTTPTLRANVVVGSLAGYPMKASHAMVHTPLLAADLTLSTGTERLALDPSYEHGVLLLDGEVSVAGTPLRPGELAYLPPERDEVDLASLPGCQVLLIGGTPHEEEFILWWNIVASSHAEVLAARAAWQSGLGGFAQLPAGAERASAPPLPPVRLRPRRGSVRPAAGR